MPVIMFKDGPLAGTTRTISEMVEGLPVTFNTETKRCDYEPTGARSGDAHIYSATRIEDRVNTPAPTPKPVKRAAKSQPVKPALIPQAVADAELDKAEKKGAYARKAASPRARKAR